jgi:hypothetical protein
MAVRPDTLGIGKCYVTEPEKQVRRIETIEGDEVRFDSRGGSTVAWSGQLRRATKATFAAEVDREVRCDHHRDYPERPVPN